MPLSPSRRLEEIAGRQQTEHSVSFMRNRISGLWCGRCSCGWLAVGGEDEIQNRAAGHDLEWLDEEPIGQFGIGAFLRDRRS